MTGWWSHLVMAPIVLPLAAGLAMLVLDGRSRNLKALIGLASSVALVAVAFLLVRQAEGGAPQVYRLGDWAAPFGIVLVLDRLSALMLALTSLLAVAALVYSLARWHRAGPHFHPLFQFLLMGLDGAFLTCDIFNLFVFFEVTLAASYGLVLHGSGALRVRAGMHYIAVNLTNSSLFLIGAALIYGVTGTLNMADLALRIPDVAAEDRMLLETGAAILGVAFLVKAAMWPLCFWLPGAYSAATPPAAAILAVTSKVGIYVLLRLSLLLFGAGAGSSAAFGNEWLLYGGLATILFGMAGVLASQETVRLVAYSVLVSSGTLLAAIGIDDVAVTAAALFYLVSSALTISAFFLLVELVERGREAGADMLAVTREAFGDIDEAEEQEEIGIPVPGTMAVLSVSFLLCGLLLAGLPPLSGFLAKFALLSGLLEAGMTPGGWGLLALLILSGFAVLIAAARAGVRTFWTTTEREVPRVGVVEMAPVAGLAGSLYKFAFDLRLLQAPTLGELAEPFGRKQVGSSAMPFKRNPINAENIDSLARFVATLPRVAWDNAAHSLLERTLDDSANRREVLPAAFLATDEIVRRATRLIRDLRVDEAAMARNLEKYGTFAATERVLMAAVKQGADRQEMHEIIREHSLAAWAEIAQGRPNPLAERLFNDDRITRYLTLAQITYLLDASHYVGDAPERARTIAYQIKNALGATG